MDISFFQGNTLKIGWAVFGGLALTALQVVT